MFGTTSPKFLCQGPHWQDFCPLDSSWCIVSNRLYHLRLCNKIFVLDNGKISQQGSFESLKNEPGFFSETYNKQTSILGGSPINKVLKKAV